MSVSRPWLALVVAVFCVPLFFNLGRGDARDDEAIYSFAVDRMLETGDWLEPKSIPNDDVVFLEKPPLKFWLVTAPIRLGLLPDDEFGRRFWDALFGAIAFVYVFLIGARLMAPAAGAIAVLVLFVHEPLLIAHGLRSNNMEGPLFLAYCGGMYHVMAWAGDPAASSRRRWHAVAAGLYFVLGFMTKFVAVAFLPLVLLMVCVLFPAWRRRLLAVWRLWAGVALLVVALVAPWLVWAHLKYGGFFWDTIFGVAVVTRFTEFLDPTHVQPWHFYWTTLWARLHDAHIEWLAVTGVSVLAVQAITRRRAEDAAVLLWFAVPLMLISIGTSKLYHYAYPFLPPLALAVGYFCALLLALGPVVLERVLKVIDRGDPARPPRWRTGVPRAVFLGIAALALFAAIFSVVFGPLRIAVDGREVFKSSGILRPLVVAVVFSVLAGITRGATRAVVAALVVSLLPLPAYRQLLVRLNSETYPMRAARDCMQRVQAATAGPGLYVNATLGELPYPIYYAFRHVRPWVRADQPSPDHLGRYLTDSAEQRPVLVTEETYQAFRYDPAHVQSAVTRSPAMVVFRDLGNNNVLLLLPGPYAVCEADVLEAQGKPLAGGEGRGPR